MKYTRKEQRDGHDVRSQSGLFAAILCLCLTERMGSGFRVIGLEVKCGSCTPFFLSFQTPSDARDDDLHPIGEQYSSPLISRSSQGQDC